MNLDLDEYQELAASTFRAFLDTHAPMEMVRNVEDGDRFNAELWKRFVDIGGTSLSLPGDIAGGGSLFDAASLAIEIGRHLAPIPYADTVAALRALHASGSTILAELLDAPLSLVLDRTAGWLRLGSDETLTGSLTWTATGAVTAFAVMLVPDLVVVDLDGPGVRRTALENLGRLPMASVDFEAVPIMEHRPVGPKAVTTARAEARVLMSAQLVGAGRRAVELAVDHVRARHQFGRPLGSFQAVQHRLADRATALDGAELLVTRAASYEQEPTPLRHYSAVALLESARAAELAAKEALQFFGGYGFITEYDIHRYLRHAKALSVIALDADCAEDALPPTLWRHSGTD